MRTSPTKTPARLAALTAVIFISAVAAAQTRRDAAARKTAAEETVVFAVHKYEAEAQLDPVAVITSGRYTAPPLGGDTALETARFKRFIRDFYRPGRKFRVLFGGGEAGSAEVIKYLEPGCVGMEASVTLQTTARLGGQVAALATNSAALGRGRGSRRAPTEAERAAALELARRAFGRNKVASARVEKMETNNLTAADLNGDGRAELIGSFIITGEFGVEDALLLIAEPGIDDFAVTLDWFHHGAEADSHYRRLVDVLDLDGDGTAEVIAQGIYYESHDYFIYKKQRGAWRVVYQGGGGGC
jgi:hypothetical protein